MVFNIEIKVLVRLQTNLPYISKQEANQQLSVLTGDNITSAYPQKESLQGELLNFCYTDLNINFTKHCRSLKSMWGVQRQRDIPTTSASLELSTYHGRYNPPLNAPTSCKWYSPLYQLYRGLSITFSLSFTGISGWPTLYSGSQRGIHARGRQPNHMLLARPTHELHQRMHGMQLSATKVIFCALKICLLYVPKLYQFFLCNIVNKHEFLWQWKWYKYARTFLYEAKKVCGNMGSCID